MGWEERKGEKEEGRGGRFSLCLFWDVMVTRCSNWSCGIVSVHPSQRFLTVMLAWREAAAADPCFYTLCGCSSLRVC